MVDVKVRAGVVVTGKVMAVDKDKAVVGVIIVDIVVVVVIITVELEMAKVVCSILVLGFAVLIRSVEIVDSDEDPGTVECFVLVLVPREGVKLVVSEVETLVALVLALVLTKMVKGIVSEELWTVEYLVLVLIKVVGFVFVEVLITVLVLGVLIKTGELVGANVELLVLVLIKVVDFVVAAEDDELGKVESLVLVLIKVDDFVVEDKVIVTVLVLGVLIKTGELVGANVELMVVISSVGL